MKRNFRAFLTTCKRLHVDKLNGAPAEPFRVYIEIKNKTLLDMCLCL